MRLTTNAIYPTSDCSPSNSNTITNHLQPQSDAHPTEAAPEITASAQQFYDLVLAPNPQEQAAFAQMLQLAQALERKDVAQVNLDPGGIVFIGVAVAERMMAQGDLLE